MHTPKMTPFFKELIEKRWSEFVQMELNSDNYTSSQAVVFAIVRACQKGKLPAIKESLSRIDGKLQEQIDIEYPKFFITFPYAKRLEGGKATIPTASLTIPDNDDIPDPEAPLITGSLRDTLLRMSEAPKALVGAILTAAEQVDLNLSHSKELTVDSDPLVKSVIVAGLLRMAHSGNLNAIFEVFDNIDGKLIDTYKILGEDVYLTSYAPVAPVGATLNKDGIYQLESENTSSAWAVSLKPKGRNER